MHRDCEPEKIIYVPPHIELAVGVLAGTLAGIGRIVQRKFRLIAAIDGILCLGAVAVFLGVDFSFVAAVVYIVTVPMVILTISRL
jgi:ABC-type dipeptide/oligopeptide/nickel transport system permease subunit